MPPTLALFLTLGFIAFLFRRDFREKPNVTWAIWIPTIWMFIIASRPLSQWFQIFGLPGFGAASVEEGSSVDAFVYGGLIALGVYVLNKRQVSLASFAEDNKWLAVFVLYCFLAIFWSDFAFISFKRWIKILGHPVMVLILITEPDPEEALIRVMKRCAYVVLPVSILWMKYYPALGRKASAWGSVTNCGIAEGKNELGSICLIFGLFFIWRLLRVWGAAKGRTRRNELYLTAGILLMTAYCLRKAHSSTSTLSLLLGVMTMMFLGLRFVDKRAITAYAVAGILVLAAAQLMFDVYGSIVDLTGHGSTIEGRGRLWQYLLETDQNPILGTGFESYWLGDRLQRIWARPEFWWRPTQAHNGYLEAYLNLGIVGLLVLLGLILVTFRRSVQELLENFEWGRLRLSYLIAIVTHNWTEAGFKGLSIFLFVWFIIIIDYRKRPHFVSTESNRSAALEEVYS
jgi:exopolysaccharide production protein ExoQ